MQQKIKILCLTCLLSLAGYLFCANSTWTAQGGLANWSDAGNWNNGVPGSGDIAYIDGEGAGGNLSILLTEDTTIGTIDWRARNGLDGLYCAGYNLYVEDGITLRAASENDLLINYPGTIHLLASTDNTTTLTNNTDSSLTFFKLNITSPNQIDFVGGYDDAQFFWDRTYVITYPPISVTGNTGTTFTVSDDVFIAGDITLGTGTTFKFNSIAFTKVFQQDFLGAGSFELAFGNAALTSTGNNFSGGVIISDASELQVAVSTLPAAGGIALNDLDATIVFGQATSGTYTGVISGIGKLVKNGAGNLTLQAANTYSGTTTINAGTLTVTTSSLPSTGGVSVGGGTTLVFDQAADGEFSGVISGTGSLEKAGTGTVTLSAVSTFSGATTIDAGRLTLEAPAGNLALPDDENIAVNAGNLRFDFDTNTVTFSGVISGAAGNLEKYGSGTLTLTSENTYAGGTEIGGTGTLVATTSAGNLTLPAATNVSITSTGTLKFDFDADTVSYTGIASGANGQLEKAGTGTLTLTGINTYGGATTISGTGTLICQTSAGNPTLPSATNVAISSTGVLRFEFDGDTITHSGNITGANGLLEKAGSGTLTLSGTNTYGGGTTLEDAGVLVVTTSSLPGDVVITGAGTVQFTQNSAGTYSGVISGANGKLTKTGTGTVTLQGTNTYQGATTISAGTLSVTGQINQNSTTTVAADAILSGNGVVGAVNNSGTITAGLAVNDVLTMSGNLTQATATAKIKVLLNTLETSSIDITGAADLGNSILELDIAPGSYPAGTQFTIISTTAGASNLFSTIEESHSSQWLARIVGNNVTITSQSNVTVTPVELNGLSTNPRNVGNYFFNNAAVNFATQDLINVADASLALTGEEPFAESLLRLSPLSAFANIFSTFQNNLQMAIVLDNEFQSVAKSSQPDKEKVSIGRFRSKRQEALDNTTSYNIPRSGPFVQPIGLFYNQRQTASTLAASSQIPFWAYTYGAGVGYQHVIANQFVVEGGIGYTHSNLNWQENFGHSKWSSLYLAPFFGWFNHRAYGNFMLVATFNFYDTHRKIQFPGVERVAKSRYNSYDILLRWNGGARFDLGSNVFFQPDGTFNFLTVMTEGYRESGAGSINLQVVRHSSYFFQPSFRLKLIQEFETYRFRYAPNIYVGWLANIPLDSVSLSSRFVDAPTNLFFNVVGNRSTTNQLILGAEFFALCVDHFEFSSCFEADLLSEFEVYTLRLKFQWLF